MKRGFKAAKKAARQAHATHQKKDEKASTGLMAAGHFGELSRFAAMGAVHKGNKKPRPCKHDQGFEKAFTGLKRPVNSYF